MRFKNTVNAIKEKLLSMKTRTAIQCLLITIFSCSAVLVGASMFTGNTEVALEGSSLEQEGGQGGFETPGISYMAESQMTAVDVAENDDAELYYHVYRMREGDVISKIAEKFGITQDTIISTNSVASSRRMQIGTYLRIPSIAGVLYTVKNDGETLESIANKYSVDVARCASVNSRKLDEVFTAGTMIFVPGGKLSWAELQEINGDLFKKPIHANWYRTSSFGWRSSPFTGARSYHSGIDMACPTGTWIYAALEGKVTATGFNNTYGNYVVVTHHSGYSTLYGHMSAITAVKGQYVTAQSRIGKVGSTGLSTGPHLHFTVFKNGKAVNPVNLWN